MAMAHPSKRRRTSSPQLHIGDLPDPLLTSVASYLPKPSRAMFAAAMTPDMSMAILLGSDEASSSGNAQLIGREWGVLDFRDIEKDLAAKLTDDNLRDVLTCIHAGEYLKTLRLAGCMSITGCGLEPLRSSAVLEHIDLSLDQMLVSDDLIVGGPSEMDPQPLLSEDKILPILESIVSANGCSLKLVVFHWKLKLSLLSFGEGHMDNFLDRYGQLLESRNPQCTLCTETCRGFIDRVYRRQNYTCNQCFQNYCNAHETELCIKCDRQLCHGCRYTACSQGGHFCKGCWSILGPPKRNMSGFFLYSDANRNDIKAAHPNARFGEMPQIISRQFKALPTEERAYWDQKAAEDKQRYDRDLALYREVFLGGKVIMNTYQ